MKKAFYIGLKVVKRIGFQTAFASLAAYLAYDKTGGGLTATIVVWFVFFALLECAYGGTQPLEPFK